MKNNFWVCHGGMVSGVSSKRIHLRIRFQDIYIFIPLYGRGDVFKKSLRIKSNWFDCLRYRLIHTPVISAFRILAIYATYLKFSNSKLKTQKKWLVVDTIPLTHIVILLENSSWLKRYPRSKIRLFFTPPSAHEKNRFFEPERVRRR